MGKGKFFFINDLSFIFHSCPFLFHSAKPHKAPTSTRRGGSGRLQADRVAFAPPPGLRRGLPVVNILFFEYVRTTAFHKSN